MICRTDGRGWCLDHDQPYRHCHTSPGTTLEAVGDTIGPEEASEAAEYFQREHGYVKDDKKDDR